MKQPFCMPQDHHKKFSTDPPGKVRYLFLAFLKAGLVKAFCCDPCHKGGIIIRMHRYLSHQRTGYLHSAPLVNRGIIHDSLRLFLTETFKFPVVDRTVTGTIEIVHKILGKQFCPLRLTLFYEEMED